MTTLRVIIGSIPERSSFNAGMIIAELVKAHKHHVSFVGDCANEFREHIEKHGFEYIGLGPEDSEKLVSKIRNTRNPIKALKLTNAMVSDIVSSMEEFAENNVGAIDLAFLDVNATFPASYFLSKNRIPTIVFLPNYASRFGLMYPPVYRTTTILGDGKMVGWWQKLKHLLAWARARFLCSVLGAGWLSWRMPIVLLTSFLSPIPKFRRQAKRNGWQFCYGEWGIRPRLPEVVVGHKSLDWTTLRSSDQRCYLASNAAPRMEFDADWCRGLDSNKPLIYCNLSTLFTDARVFFVNDDKKALRKNFRRFKRYLDVVVAALTARPEWQLVVACGPFAETFCAASLPENIRVVQRVPQLNVLKRAALVITQGGAGTIRECATLGVPMLVFPMWSDQFGNAARVQHYKMGLHGGDYRKVSKRKLIGLIERLMNDRTIAFSVSEFKDHCVDNRSEWQEFQSFVERHTGLRL